MSCAFCLGWVLTWGRVHELLWVVAEQSVLDVATAHTAGPCRERGMDAGVWQEILVSLHSSGSEKRCRAPEVLPRICFLSWSVASPAGGGTGAC